MILRRFSQALKDQNWAAIAIEFVLLVLGVFLGIQVANWNVERETGQRSAIFTERLKADLREEDWTYQFLIAYNREVLANANRTVEALEGRAALSDEVLLVSAYRATQYRNRNQRSSTFDELISTGNIGLIRDRTLRGTAIQFYNLAALDILIREGRDSLYRQAFRTSLPNHVQRAISKHCGDRVARPGDYTTIQGTLDYPCRTGMSVQDIATSASALRANPEILRSLRLRVADLETRLFDLTRNNRSVMESLRAIATEPQ